MTNCQAIAETVLDTTLYLKQRRTKRYVGMLIISTLLANKYFEIKKIDIILLCLHLGGVFI